MSKENLQGILKEKSLISERLIHDTSVCSSNAQVHTFTISSTPRKSCKFPYIKYKADLENRERRKKLIREMEWKSKVEESANTEKKNRKRYWLTHLVLCEKL